MADGFLEKLGTGLVAFGTGTSIAQIEADRAAADRSAEIQSIREQLSSGQQPTTVPTQTGLRAPPQVPAGQPTAPPEGIPRVPAPVSQFPTGQAPAGAPTGLQAAPPPQPTGLQPTAVAQQPVAAQQPKQKQLFDRLFQLDPEAAQSLLDGIGARKQSQRVSAANRAFKLLNTPFEQRREEILAQAAQLKSEGRDPSDVLELLDQDQESQDFALNATQSAALSVEKRLERAEGGGITNIIEAEGGGFIGISEGRSVFIPPVEGVRTEKQAKAERVKEEKRIETETDAQKTRFDQTKNLRAEITKASNDFNKVDAAFTRIKAVTKDVSAAGDLALIFNFMKMLDPGSVVRESEFATAANSAGVPERIRAQYNKVLRGERLGVNQRQDFVNQAKNLFSAAKIENTKSVERIVSIGERFNLEREDLLGEITEELEPTEDVEPVGGADRLQGLRRGTGGRTGAVQGASPQGQQRNIVVDF